MSHNCCRDYTRSQLMRHAASGASTALPGRGLPAIEPGMPQPAGTGLSRRSFLSRTAGLALAVYGASKLPLAAFEEGIASADAGRPILVSIFFDGGIDSLNLLPPVGDPLYAGLRPTLALAPGQGTPLAEDPRLHFHPAASSLATLYGEGKVTVFPAIGYTHPDQSHFTSRHYWEIGELDVGSHAGWLGRYLDIAGDNDNPLQGLSLDGELQPALATASKPVAAVDDVEGYGLWSRVGDPVEARMFNSFGRVGTLASDSPAMSQVRTATAQTERLREQLQQFTGFTSPVQYPDGNFAHQLGGVAAMIAAGLPLNCITISAVGGYDTHSEEAGEFESNVRRTCDAVLAFQRDLEARGLADRVLIEMWSEFGRRPEENGSGGTDHGAAGCAFIVGSKAAGGMVGEYPGLASLDPDDNLKVTSDFRAMYCALLDQWLGADPEAIIPGAAGFSPPTLVRP